MKKLFGEKKILLIILTIAAFLRFIGVNPGYNNYHSDEPIIYGVAVDMIRNGNLDPGRLDYGGASIYINYILYRILFIPLSWLKYYFVHASDVIEGIVHIPIAPLEARRILQVYIFGYREINVLFWGRYIIAFFSLGTVLMTYLLGKKFFGKEVGLLAPLLLAFNFRHVLNSHINLPDIYNSFFLVLATLAAVNLWKNPSLRNYVIGGIAAGVSFSVKYQVFGFAPLLLAHFYASSKKGGVDIKKLFGRRAIISLLCIPLTFLVINPYFLVHIENALYWMVTISQKYSMGIKRFNLYPFSYLYHIDYGPIEFIATALGMVIAVIKYFKKSLIFLSIIFPFFFIFTYYSNGGFYVRNFITTTPFFMIFAALGILTVQEIISRRLGKMVKPLILIALVIPALFVPAENSIINSYYDTKPWNYNLTADWMRSNLPSNAIVAANPFDPPGGPDIKKTEFKLDGAYSLAEHKEDGADYALVNLDWASNAFYFWTNYGFNEAYLFWNKPIDIMRNTFYGLAIEELFRYQIFSATKPWQAPDANLVLAKIPDWPMLPMAPLKKYSFDSGEESWQVRGNIENLNIKPFFDQENGHLSPGSLILAPTGSKFATIRLSSPPIPVHPGYLYKISGWLKTNPSLVADKRDGFLRLDFYKTEKDVDRLGMISALSSRVYGTSDWTEKKITERAPDGANFLTISLQTAGSYSSVWLDDVVVSESVSVAPDLTSSSPYVKKEIDLDTLYPYSHGNL